MSETIAGNVKSPQSQPPEEATARQAARVADAGRQFEALLLGQILKTVQASSSGGWLGTEEDQSAGSMMELAGEQFAQALAAQGGLGLAKMVVASMPADRLTTANPE
jgi:Rod binding domain-containing protein